MTKVLAYDLHRVTYSIHPGIAAGFAKQGFQIVNYDEIKELPECDFLLMVGLPDDNDSGFIKQLSKCKRRYLLCYSRISYYLKKEFADNRKFFKQFEGFYTLTQPGSKQYEFLKATYGLPVYPVDINFYDFDDTKAQPFRNRNDNIIYFGRFMTFKGCEGLLHEREILTTKYNLVAYGLHCFKKLKGGGNNFALTDLQRFTLWKTHRSRELKPNIWCHYEKDMYDPNYKVQPGGLNLFGPYDLERLKPIIRLSRYAIFPYLYKPKRPGTLDGLYDQVPEYTLLEAINFGIPVIVTNEYAKNYIFCGQKRDLREVFICFDDLKEINDKCAEYEKHYDRNVAGQKAYFKEFYKNDAIMENLLNPVFNDNKRRGFSF